MRGAGEGKGVGGGKGDEKNARRLRRSLTSRGRMGSPPEEIEFKRVASLGRGMKAKKVSAAGEMLFSRQNSISPAEIADYKKKKEALTSKAAMPVAEPVAPAPKTEPSIPPEPLKPTPPRGIPQGFLRMEGPRSPMRMLHAPSPPPMRLMPHKGPISSLGKPQSTEGGAAHMLDPRALSNPPAAGGGGEGGMGAVFAPSAPSLPSAMPPLTRNPRTKVLARQGSTSLSRAGSMEPIPPNAVSNGVPLAKTLSIHSSNQGLSRFSQDLSSYLRDSSPQVST